MATQLDNNQQATPEANTNTPATGKKSALEKKQSALEKVGKALDKTDKLRAEQLARYNKLATEIMQLEQPGRFRT